MLKNKNFFSFIIIIFTNVVNSNCLGEFINNNESTRKTYYFKFNRPTNEFRIHSRINYLNHNITNHDFNYNYYHNRNRNNPQRIDFIKAKDGDGNNKDEGNSFENKIHKNLNNYLLDEEWNFNHSTIVKDQEIPLFLERFYQSTYQVSINDSLDPNYNVLRILFNKNTNKSSSIIKFDLRSLAPFNESIVDAELFIYCALENDSKVFEKPIVMRVYQFDWQRNQDVNESILVENPDVHKLFNVVYVTKARRGWQAFKIKKPLENWLNGEMNFGLLITISSYEDNKLISVFNDTNLGKFRTFAVVKLQKNGTQPNLFNTVQDHQLSQIDSPYCHRLKVYIDFKTIGWDKFILAPEGFDTFECSGRCLSISNNTINHLKLLNFVKQKTGCCAPLDYLALPIMFYDRFNNIVIKKYDNLIPIKCACR